MFGNETLDLIYSVIGAVVVIVGLVSIAIGSFFDSKKTYLCNSKDKRLFMIVYHKRERDLEEEEKEFALGECAKPAHFFKTYQKAKKHAKVEIDGDLKYNSASIYLLNRSSGFILKIAELGERGEKAVGEEKTVEEGNA